MMGILTLTHLWLMFSLYILENKQKTPQHFLIFSGGTKWEPWREMGLKNSLIETLHNIKELFEFNLLMRGGNKKVPHTETNLQVCVTFLLPTRIKVLMMQSPQTRRHTTSFQRQYDVVRHRRTSYRR